MDAQNSADAGLMDDVEKAQAELKSWMAKVEKADDVKARLVLEKLEEADNKSKAQQEMLDWVKKQEDCQKDFDRKKSCVREEIRRLSKDREINLEELRRSQALWKERRDESNRLKQKFKICTQIPDAEVNFVGPNEAESVEGDAGQRPIRGVFTISQIPVVRLRGGQALITFENKKVASQILRTNMCSVSCESSSIDVKPRRIAMDSAVKYEIGLDVSRKDLEVSGIASFLPEERMKDRLEISFCKPSLGGGEVESVRYDPTSGTGRVTFLNPGVAERLAIRGTYAVLPDRQVKVGPSFKYQLGKFQTFSCVAERSVLVEDVADVEDEEDLQDHLEIHFQKPSNNGGEIESIKYVSAGKDLQAVFCEDETDD